MADDRKNLDDALDARIAAAKRSSAVPTGLPAKGYNQGSRVLAELVGAPIGGGLIGWLLDKWFGTSPWLLLIVLTLAIVAAFRNILRMAKEPAE